MRSRKSRIAAVLLLVLLPLSLSASPAVPGGAKNGPERYFSLSIESAAAARAVSFGPEKFTLGSLSRDFLKDAGEIWSYPVHVRTRDVLPIAGIALLTGILIHNDEAIHRTFIDFRKGHGWVKTISPLITEMGSLGAWATAGVFLGFGLAARDAKAVETAALAASAMAQSGILVTFLKGVAGRQRPFWDQGRDGWSGPVGFFTRFGAGQAGRYDSFPGGHSITAFSLATVVAMQYRESRGVSLLAYSLATGVALSRLTENKHWFSDCLVGGVLGHVIGRMVVLNHRRRYSIVPTAGVVNGTLSLAVTVSSR